MFTKNDSNSNAGGRTVTKEDQKATISALLEERRGYVNRGMDDRVAEVDKQLKALGHKAERQHKRAERRPAAEHPAAETR